MNFIQEAQALQEKMVARRRDFHRYPESAWTEYRTAAFVASTLTELGYEVACGAQVIAEAAMMGVPAAEVLAEHEQRAIAEGADPAWVAKMAGGKTGVVGTMRFAKPGKTVALRFDMDANDVGEATDEAHRPVKEGFASCHPGVMHACGHDGHTALGLAVAEILAGAKDQLCGTLKIIFQPAEEGVRGARAMVEAGVVDGVDYFFGLHLGFNANKAGQFACMTDGFLATTKLDARFTGLSSHAGAAPEQGKNALLAAAASSIAAHSISRHGKGASRINVGVLQAGTGRNVLPDRAVVKLETRGATTDINEFMINEVKRMVEASAMLYDVKVETEIMGGAPSCSLDREMGEKVCELVKASGRFGEVIPLVSLGASEDCAYFMERVQQQGGQAVYSMLGTPIAAGHHNLRFDFDENCLVAGAATSAELAAAFLGAQR